MVWVPDQLNIINGCGLVLGGGHFFFWSLGFVRAFFPAHMPTQKNMFSSNLQVIIRVSSSQAATRSDRVAVTILSVFSVCFCVRVSVRVVFCFLVCCGLLRCAVLSCVGLGCVVLCWGCWGVVCCGGAVLLWWCGVFVLVFLWWRGI